MDHQDVHVSNPKPGRNHSYNMTPSQRTPHPRVPEIPSATHPPPTHGTPLISCENRIRLDYEITPAVICALCFVFGILYCFLGYRFFKATMFLTGFIFGSVVTYLICLEEQLLPMEGKIGVALLVGILVGLITMLVQYVGLFMTGFCLGGLLGTGALVIIEQFYHPTTIWICIGVIFLTGLLCALLILYFQKGLTIFGTSLCGSALITVSLDYFIEQFMVVKYAFDCMRNATPGLVCWFSWVIMGIWPALFLIGSLTQWKITGKGIDHREVVRVRKQKKVNLKKIRKRETKQDAQKDTSSQPQAKGYDFGYSDDQPHNRYRHLYQVRRVNGDVISQSYIQSIQHKLSTAVRKKVVTRRDNLPPTEIDQSTTSLTETPPTPDS